MLAVISDIHFQDTLNDAILNDENKMINSDRNVSIDAFKETFDKIISLAKDNKANELLILLAGDIFDMHRSQKWCETEVRPYGKYTVAQWGPIAENILEDIINCNINTFTYFKHCWFILFICKTWTFLIRFFFFILINNI